MNIEIIRSLKDAGKAKGLAVVIDVFRAFSTEAYIFANGADKIIPVEKLEDAYTLKRENPDYVLIGERGGIKPDGFDFGNSPTEIVHVDFSKKIIVHTTSNGTKGLANASNAQVVLVGSFVIADSIVKYIKNNNLLDVSLISTAPDTENDNEDLMLAYYIKNSLEGALIDEIEIKKMMTKTSAYSYLFNEALVPKTDFDLCLDFNRFNFIIKKSIVDNQICLVKEEV